jgi:hypothetical protein
MERCARVVLRAAAFCLGLGITLPAWSQYTPQGLPNPVIPLTAQAAGTVNSGNLLNTSGLAATCVFNQASHTSGPSSTFSIQGLDPGGSGNYYTLVTSSAITADATPTVLAAGKGVQTVANVSSALPVPTTWRASTTVGGTATFKQLLHAGGAITLHAGGYLLDDNALGVTGTISCLLN